MVVSDARTAIEALIAEYADLVDDGDFAGVGDLFARGRVCDPDGTVLAEGAAAVRRLYETTTRRYPDGTPRTQHSVTNLRIELADREARARSRFLVHQAVEDGGLRPVIAGRYHDRFADTGDGWHFVERRMEPRLTGDLRDHLLIDLPARGGQ